MIMRSIAATFLILSLVAAPRLAYIQLPQLSRVDPINDYVLPQFYVGVVKLLHPQVQPPHAFVVGMREPNRGMFHGFACHPKFGVLPITFFAS